jgi:UDP-2-acetamido-3-amino-2,3-dideoxy-glucuronate N-acetyltransferase
MKLIGDDLKIGKYVIIEDDVKIGNNVKIGHRVTLKSGTVVGNNTIIDDHCITTGACYIGNNISIRTGAIISKATIIEDYCFIGPGVITNHTKNITHGRNIKNIQLLTYISYGCIIGSQASILAGITIHPQIIIGAGSVIIKDLISPGIYVGSPAKKKKDLPDEYKLEIPKNAGKMYYVKDILTEIKRFLPNLNFGKLEALK